MGATDEGGSRHSVKVDSGIRGEVEGRGRVLLVGRVPELVVGCAHWLGEVYWV